MKTILLIDDDENILSTFSLALRHHGYRVIEASSGETGIELARQHLPDLILSDISMPGKDGQEVLHSIRQHTELSGKQVVLMTGQTHLVTLRKGMELGADDFLVKPVSLGDLLRCVEARLQRAQIHWRVEDRLLTKLRSSLRSTLPHELFTPLGGIIGLAEILRSDLKKLSTSESEELLEDVHASALRLHRTLRNYLMTIDLQAPEKKVKLTERLQAGQVRESLMSGLKTAAERHGRKDDVKPQLEAVSIIATPSDLSLIAEELADNACKFSRKGTAIDFVFGKDGILIVTDLGRGMTSEEIAEVGTFQQFDRKKQEQQGLGLGLALIQKLTDGCGATLSMESVPAKGTTVRIAFQVVP
jgi:two-component system, sensor histidine kinase and response regulator